MCALDKLQDVSVSHLTMGRMSSPKIDKEICYVQTVDETVNDEEKMTPRMRNIAEEYEAQFEYSPLCTKRSAYECDENKCRESKEVMVLKESTGYPAPICNPQSVLPTGLKKQGHGARGTKGP